MTQLELSGKRDDEADEARREFQLLSSLNFPLRHAPTIDTRNNGKTYKKALKISI